VDLSSLLRASGTADASVRPAFPDDAAEIARIQVVTWRTAYGSVLPPSVLDDWDADAAFAAWQRAVAAPPTPGHGVLVALERNTVVGFAAYGPAELSGDERPDPAGPTIELSTLLVEPRWGRRGHGGRLLAAAAAALRADGARYGLAWVPEPDAASRNFYKAAGWTADGTVRVLDTGEGQLREVRVTGSLELELT
jgi:GNAT superfamily N-acetyltransferase